MFQLWNIWADVQFSLKSDKGLSRQIDRIFCNRTRAIAKYPEYSGKRTEVEVHEVRKEIQKLRALLKLIRGRLSGKVYRKQNKTLRLAAHALSPLRDADVALRSLQQFMCRQKDKDLHSICGKLKKTLVKRRAEAYFEEPSMRKELRAQIGKATMRFQEVRYRKIHRSDICEGLGQSYKHGLKAYRAANRLRSKENLHEWRKRVKRLRHELSLMEEVLPSKLLKPLDELKSLSDCLGDDHDLAILDEVGATEALALTEWKAFSAVVAEERFQLQQSAFLMGERLYADSPASFVKKIQQGWDLQRKL